MLQVGGKYLSRSRQPFGQYIFSCRPGRNGTGPPRYVSLVTRHTTKLTNLLPIHVPQTANETIEFGVCVKTTYGQQDAFRLVEWLEAHRMWGVGEVNFYAMATDNITDGTW